MNIDYLSPLVRSEMSVVQVKHFFQVRITLQHFKSYFGHRDLWAIWKLVVIHLWGIAVPLGHCWRTGRGPLSSKPAIKCETSAGVV